MSKQKKELGVRGLCEPAGEVRSLELARVLLIEDHLVSRLILQTILEAAGYSVNVAASVPEAFSEIDEHEFELVLSSSRLGDLQSGAGVLAYARSKDYKPATALIRAYQDEEDTWPPETHERQVSIDARDVSKLLSRVADLIGLRASRRAERTLRHLTAG